MTDYKKPYKSRLFNFLNRQFIKLNSQVNLKFRQFNYLTTTGVKTILAPVFLIWQNWQKNTNKTFSGTSPQELEKAKLSSYFPEYQLALPSCDHLITELSEIIKKNDHVRKLSIDKQPYLACCLETDSVVLVDQKAKIYNLFSQTQQQELNLFIREIRADYHKNTPFPALKLGKQKNNHKGEIKQTNLSSPHNLFINGWQKIKQDLIKIKKHNLTKYDNQEKEQLTKITKTNSSNYNLSEKNDNLPSILTIFYRC